MSRRSHASRQGLDGNARPAAALQAGVDALVAAQDADGSWHGDYGGPLFLLPLYVVTCHGTGVPLDAATRTGMARYLRGVQRHDGGWGLHVEGHSHVYTTALNYVALRLLGAPPEDPAAVAARTFLHAHGGAARSGPWGKFALALLHLMPYEGVLPTPPELWLLPRALPMHPSRFWCHSRMVYLPMAYLYGARVQAPLDDTLRALREELYGRPYAEIDWRAERDQVAATDVYVEPSPALWRLTGVLTRYEARPLGPLRRRALDFVLDQVDREDQNTNYLCIGPVSKLLHLWVWQHAEPGGARFRRHVARLPDYLWHGDDGVKMQGYNSSQLWDTTFAVQALAAAGADARHPQAMQRALGFVAAQQLLADTPDPAGSFRHRSRGGWPFSTLEHGWPISDCTAEGLKCMLHAPALGHPPLDGERARWAVDWLLSMQNADGGWATYEPTRGPAWLEALNPALVFGKIMIDYSYPECTSACLQALAAIARQQPRLRRRAVRRAIRRGTAYLRATQRPDGAWEGSWGICFTYGTWFGIWGLRAAGAPADDPAVVHACDYLAAHQGPDGGWGEHANSCRQHRYVATAEGQAVMTSWALMGLIAGGRADSPTVDCGVAFLVERQRADGTWPPEHIAGMFNHTCAIHYDNYLKVFPVWALALHAEAVAGHLST